MSSLWQSWRHELDDLGPKGSLSRIMNSMCVVVTASLLLMLTLLRVKPVLFKDCSSPQLACFYPAIDSANCTAVLFTLTCPISPYGQRMISLAAKTALHWGLNQCCRNNPTINHPSNRSARRGPIFSITIARVRGAGQTQTKCANSSQTAIPQTICFSHRAHSRDAVSCERRLWMVSARKRGTIQAMYELARVRTRPRFGAGR